MSLPADADKLGQTLANLQRDIPDLKTSVAGQERAITEIRTLLQDQAAARAVEAANAEDKSYGEAIGAVRVFHEPLPRNAPPGALTLEAGERSVLLVAGDNKVIRLRGEDGCDGLLDGPSVCDWQAELKRLVRAQTFARAVLGAAEPARPPRTPKLDARLRAHCNAAPAWLRSSLVTALDGQGGELITTSVLPEISAPNVQISTVMGWLQEATAPAVGSSFEAVQFDGVPRVYGTRVATVNDPAGAAKGKVQTSSKVIALAMYTGCIQVDRTYLEDTVIQMMPQLDALLQLGMELALADARINGDTDTNAPTDALAAWNPRSIFTPATPADGDDHRNQELGWRAEAFDSGATLDMGALQSFLGMCQLAEKLGPASYAKFVPGGDLMFVASIAWAIKKLIHFPELITLDKLANPAIMAGLGGFGMPSGSNKPGLIGAVGGAPIIVDPFMSDDLANTGKFTGAGQTKSGLICVDRGNYKTYKKPSYVLEKYDNQLNHQRYILARRRQVTASARAVAAKTVSFGFNLG